MSCMWYDPSGGRFGTCFEKCPDSSHNCPSDGDVNGCDLWSPFGGRPSVVYKRMQETLREGKKNDRHS